MKRFLVQTMLLLGFAISYGFSYGQSAGTNCALKGTPDCPIAHCPKKGTRECPYLTTAATPPMVALKAYCPLKGTPACPLEKCPRKGTPDCPLVEKESGVSYAAIATPTPQKEHTNLPPCCRKSVD